MALLLLSPGAPAAHAQGTIRYARPAATGSGDCLSWANACTLQTALTGAGLGDQIWVMQGVHTPGTLATDTFQLKNLVSIYGGFVGTETDLSQRDPIAHVTILSGEIGAPGDITDNLYHVVTGINVTSVAILDGFTITGGLAVGTSHDCGGGVYLSNSSPTLMNVIFSGNMASYGGGLCSADSTGLI